MTADQTGAAVDYPDPRLAPWPGFALAAAAAVQHLDDLTDLDLWLVTALEGDLQTVVAATGAWSSSAPVGTTFPWAQSFCLRMVARQGPTAAPDISAVPAYAQVAVGPLAPVRAYVGVPIEGEDGVLYGTLCGFAGEPRSPDLAACLGSVELLGRLLSTVLAREQFAAARSAEAAEAQARVERDAVTGLLNERGWHSALSQEDVRCQRYGGTPSVLALHLDEPPDPAAERDEERLVRCAEVLTRICRPGDVVARLGRADFAVLALHCDPVAALALHKRLRVQLRTAGLEAVTGAATRRSGERLAQAWSRAQADARRDGRRRRPVAGDAAADVHGAATGS